MTTRAPQGYRQRERGAILVHVAVAFIGLLSFSALTIDYGVMWVSRREAQNAADAGALAGALSLAFEAPGDVSPTGRPRVSARAVAVSHLVWGQAPSVTVASDVTVGPCPDPLANPNVIVPGTDVCLRVDVYRDQAHANPLPTYFAQLVGIGSQDVRATATARVMAGNSTNCLKPWAVADKWDEADGAETDWNSGLYPDGDPDFWNATDPDGVPTSTATFDPYEKKDPEPDLYVPPQDASCYGSITCAGTGYHIYDTAGNTCCDYGRRLRLKISQEETQVSSGWFLALRLLDSTGGADYNWNIKNCNGTTVSVGDALPLDTEPGNKVGPTRQGVESDIDSLVNKDPNATWNDDYFGPGQGAVISPNFGPNQSPRIVPIPVFNVDEYLATGPSGMSTIVVRNILGFFIEGMCPDNNKQVCGRLTSIPGDFATGGGTVSGPSSFIKKIVLIR
jgi:hypothetical protein